MELFEQAGDGLKKMWMSSVVAILCMILSFFPFVSLLALIVSVVATGISFQGLYEAGKEIPGCRQAFWFTAGNMVTKLLSLFLQDGVASFAVSFLGSIFSLLAIYFICQAMESLMEELKEERAAHLGTLVWKLNLFGNILSLVMFVMTFFAEDLPFSTVAFSPFLRVLSVVILLISVVASVLYILFLRNCGKVVDAHSIRKEKEVKISEEEARKKAKQDSSDDQEGESGEENYLLTLGGRRWRAVGMTSKERAQARRERKEGRKREK